MEYLQEIFTLKMLMIQPIIWFCLIFLADSIAYFYGRKGYSTILRSKLIIIEKSNGFFVARRRYLLLCPTNEFICENTTAHETLGKAQICLERLLLDEKPIIHPTTSKPTIN